MAVTWVWYDVYREDMSMFGGYKFGRFGSEQSRHTGEMMDWLLLAAVYAGVTWFITRLLVRLGKVQPQNEMSAWLKVMGAGVLVVIVLLILLDECLI